MFRLTPTEAKELSPSDIKRINKDIRKLNLATATPWIISSIAALLAMLNAGWHWAFIWVTLGTIHFLCVWAQLVVIAGNIREIWCDKSTALRDLIEREETAEYDQDFFYWLSGVIVILVGPFMWLMCTYGNRNLSALAFGIDESDLPPS